MKSLRTFVFGTVLFLGMSLFNQSKAQVVLVHPKLHVAVATPCIASFRGDVWIPGKYYWNGFARRYYWTAGYWRRPLYAGRVWVAGCFRPVRGGYVWIRGYWG